MAGFTLPTSQAATLPIAQTYTPYMRMVSNAEIEANARAEMQAKQNTPAMTGLAAYVRKRWDEAKRAKEPIETRLIACLQQRNGEYSPEKLAKIRLSGGSEIFMMITDIKCRTLESWIKDILIPPDDKSWTIEPTPVPELPPDATKAISEQIEIEMTQAVTEFGVQVEVDDVLFRIDEIKSMVSQKLYQKAKAVAERMERKINDQLAEGGWKTALSDFIIDYATFPNAFIKGPITRKRKVLKYQDTAEGFRPAVEEKFVNEWERVSPFDAYPGPDARHINHSYFIERMQMDVLDLSAMRGVKGYDEKVIEELITRYGETGYRSIMPNDSRRQQLEGRSQQYLSQGSTIEILNFWGKISGFLLLEWGMSTEQVPDAYAVYEANVWMCNDLIVRAVLNDDPLGRRPYFKEGFSKIPGAFWDKGLPEVMRHDQDMCNASARALANNMGIASGPQAVINDVGRLPKGEDVTEMYPWKIWQFNRDELSTSHRPPIEFYQPNPMVDALLKVFEHFSRSADEHTGIPRYAYGDTSIGGAGGTASGLSMLINQMSKVLKSCVLGIDITVIEPSIERQYMLNMLYDDDPSIKSGDLRIRPRGAVALMVKEQQQVRRNEFLVTSNNPVDMAIIGNRGRAELLREVVKTMDMPVDKIVPNDDTLAQQEAAMQAQAMMPPAPQTLDPAGNPVAGQDAALF